MKPMVLALPFLLVGSSMGLNPAETAIDDIERTLAYYLEGHATGNPAIMTQAFHESARLQFMADGEYRTRTLEAYLGGMSGSPAADEHRKHRRIVSIDYVENAATAKIELDYPGALLTDYMQLLKIDGEWKIVNKIFTSTSR